MSLSVSDKKIKWLQDRLIAWGKSNYSDFPWRSCERPIHQLIAEILLQRTKAEQVVPVFERLLEDYPDVNKLSNLTESEWRNVIQPLGLHWRAPLIYRMLHIIVNKYNGLVPEDAKLLQELPGVGSYVSSSYLSLQRSKRASIIDSNVVRIYARFFGFDYNNGTRRKNWLANLASKATPKRRFRNYNYALLDFARGICKPKPLCKMCSLKLKCVYFARGNY